MKIKTNKIILDEKGKDIKIETDNNKSVDLKYIITNSLFIVLEEDNKLDGKNKYEIYLLQKKLAESKDEIELTSEEITLIKNRIAKAYAPLVMGQAWDILEGK